MGLKEDPSKLLSDTTQRVLDLVYVYFDDEHLDSFERKMFRENLTAILEEVADLGEERFQTAYRTGEDEGYDRGREETKEEIADKLQAFLDDL